MENINELAEKIANIMSRDKDLVELVTKHNKIDDNNMNKEKKYYYKDMIVKTEGMIWDDYDTAIKNMYHEELGLINEMLSQKNEDSFPLMIVNNKVELKFESSQEVKATLKNIVIKNSLGDTFILNDKITKYLYNRYCYKCDFIKNNNDEFKFSIVIE